MGQRRPVTSIRLVVQDSIETKMQELQEKKAKLANMGLTKMTRQQIIEQRVSLLRLEQAIRLGPLLLSRNVN